MYLLAMPKYNFHLFQICPPVVLFIIFSPAVKQLPVLHRNHDDPTSIKNCLHAINHKNRLILTIIPITMILINSAKKEQYSIITNMIENNEIFILQELAIAISHHNFITGIYE